MSLSNSISKFFLPIIFGLILLLPFVNSNFKFWEYERWDENRVFHDSVIVDFGKLDYFPSSFDAYHNDNFSFRTPLLNFYHSLKFNYLKVSPHPEKLIIGAEGWYFNAGKEKDAVEGKMDFSEESLQSLSKEWQRRKDYLDSKNIKFYWVIAPSKHSVYPEKLPFNVYQSKERRVVKMKNYLNDSFSNLIIDPLEEMSKIKDNTKLYYKLDNHWSLRSGKLVSDLIIKAIKKDFPEANLKSLPNYEWRDSVVKAGIHYDVIGIKSLSEVREYPVLEKNSTEVDKYGFPPVKGFAYPWEYERRFTNNNLDTGLRILFIRDSFGEQLFPFIRESFKESVFIFDAWQYKLNKPIIEKIQPDVVVFLTLETLIDAVIKDYPEEKSTND